MFPRLPIIFAISLVFSPPIVHGEENAKWQLLDELSAVYLGKIFPRPEYEGKLQKCVVLAEAGTGLPQLTGVAEEAENALFSVIDKRAVISAYDAVARAEDGIANIEGGRNLYDLWQEVLSDCKPETALLAPKSIQRTRAEKLLYQVPDKVDQSRGVIFIDEPSEIYKKYIMYRDFYSLLEAQTSDDGSWRLSPNLNHFLTLKSAKKSIWEDWNRFGRKEDVEVALDAVLNSKSSERWRSWNAARAAWDSNSVSISQSETFGRTYLYPQPELWASMALWQNFRMSQEGPLKAYQFQCARIKIIRPWFRIEDLLTGKIIYDSRIKAPLSKGIINYPKEFPRGRLPMIVSELILVRNIRSSQSSAENEVNPLSRFSFPDAINLLGYVVDVISPEVAP